MTQYCTNCGAVVPEGAKFCPKCGTAITMATTTTTPPATATPPATTPARSSRRALAIGVPIALGVLLLIGLAVLAGMPFQHENRKLTRPEQPSPNVVNEQEASTATTARIGEEQPANATPAGRGIDVVPITTATMPPNIATAPVPAPMPAPATAPQMPPQTAPPPRAVTTTYPQPAPVPTPVPVPSSRPTRKAPPPKPETPPESAPAAAAELSESQAEDIVRGFVVSRDYYQAGGAECVGVVTNGYSNRGYNVDVVDRCGDRGRLGRWRVDAVTRELFVQKADGRYLRP